MNDTSKTPGNLSLIAVIFGFGVCVMAVGVSANAASSALVPAYMAAFMVGCFSIVSWWRARLARKQALEEEQVVEFRRTHAGTELFDDADEAVRLATRVNEHYVKYAVPAFCILLGVALVGRAWFLWSRWSTALAQPMAKQPLPMGTLAVVLAVGCVLFASYFTGASRERGARWLRPCSAWMFLTAALFLLGAVAMFWEYFDPAATSADLLLGKVGLCVLLALGAELVAGVVIELYRPRMPGEQERPLVESRLLALFTEPGGLARNIATALDYQFGFKVSEVWFYRFVERSLAPLLAAAAVLLWLMTTIVVINPEENGIRETFGRVANQTPLTPGFYLKWPTPFGRIRTFPVERVQSFSIGYLEGDHAAEHEPPMDPENDLQGDKTGGVIVWARRHLGGETKFVVASEASTGLLGSGDTEGTSAGKPMGSVPVTVYYMSASMPLYYKVSNLYDYSYRHVDAQETLKKITMREIVNFLAGNDFFWVLTKGRENSGATLTAAIQTKANELKLGVEIVFLGVQGMHPPVEVGAAFDGVVGANETMHRMILSAEAEAIAIVPTSQGKAERLKNEALAYKANRTRVPAAEAQRFRSQLLGFNASPEIFVLNNFLGVLEKDATDVRKYIIGANQGTQVYIINLEKKLRPDLFDMAIDTKTE
ncbi:MAG: hypothetical protein KAI66_02835 [Lentisphaeria bacterium]|nr:hypothetical protein [Lentisphaeria bacterium]